MTLPQKTGIDVPRLGPWGMAVLESPASAPPVSEPGPVLWDPRWDQLPIAMYACDTTGRIAGFNALAAKIWGREPRVGDPLERYCGSVRLYVAGRPINHDECPMAEVLRNGTPVHGTEITVERMDGSRLVLRAYIDPVRDAAGAITGAINCLQDITDLRWHQDTLAAREAQQRALLDEVNHRVKNTLATVQSLASFTFRDPRVPVDVREAFVARLLALSSIHNQLAREQWEAADLRSVLEDIFAPHQDDAGRRITLEGEPVRITSKLALTLSLVLHELATNAMKYGALSRPDGALNVSWTVVANDDRRLHVEWRETGGPPVRPPERRGFGSRLLERSIRRELKGEVELSFAAAGVSCVMDIPLSSSP